MNQTQLIKTLDTIENTFASLRGVIDDLHNQADTLKQDQDENVRVRSDIISTQKQVLEKINKLKEDEKLLESKQEALKSERRELDNISKEIQQKKEALNKQELEVKEKLEVAKNLDKWTAEIEEREQILKSNQAKLKIREKEFEEEKNRVMRQHRANQEFNIKLENREKKLISRESRVSKILNDI